MAAARTLRRARSSSGRGRRRPPAPPRGDRSRVRTTRSRARTDCCARRRSGRWRSSASRSARSRRRTTRGRERRPRHRSHATRRRRRSTPDRSRRRTTRATTRWRLPAPRAPRDRSCCRLAQARPREQTRPARRAPAAPCPRSTRDRRAARHRSTPRRPRARRHRGLRCGCHRAASRDAAVAIVVDLRGDAGTVRGRGTERDAESAQLRGDQVDDGAIAGDLGVGGAAIRPRARSTASNASTATPTPQPRLMTMRSPILRPRNRSCPADAAGRLDRPDRSSSSSDRSLVGGGQHVGSADPQPQLDGSTQGSWHVSGSAGSAHGGGGGAQGFPAGSVPRGGNAPEPEPPPCVVGSPEPPPCVGSPGPPPGGGGLPVRRIAAAAAAGGRAAVRADATDVPGIARRAHAEREIRAVGGEHVVHAGGRQHLEP